MLKIAFIHFSCIFKYATLTSVDVNKQLFPTENDVYNNILNAVQVKLGVIFTPKQYREYKQYMMNMIYSQVPIINTPLTITEEGWLNDNNEAIVKSTENNTNYWNAEISRIFGFETTQKLILTLKMYLILQKKNLINLMLLLLLKSILDSNAY